MKNISDKLQKIFVKTKNGQKELNAKDIVIAGDPSAAAIVGSAALITPQSEIKIKKVKPYSPRTFTFVADVELSR